MDKEYICGCGKAYGSYPAFSTHRKNKHNNETVPGTKMPSQDKAKRGRPSYDFKKVPRGNVNQAAAFEGLSVIEYGLLELEDKFKGKILSDPITTIEHELPPTLITKVEQGQSELLEGFISFIKQITNHMTRTIASATITFICKVIEHGIANHSLHTMHLYNQYFTRYLEEIKNYPLGMEFYIDICVIMAKWLKVLGYTNESLKVKQKKKKQASSLD